MAKLNNEQARMRQDEYYNGRRGDWLSELKFYGGTTVSYEFYDQYNKPFVIKDCNGDVVSRREW